MKIITLPAILLLTSCALLAPAAAQTPDKYRSWTLRHVEPSEVRHMLVELLGDKSQDVRILADDEQNELLLLGPLSSQKLAEQLIEGVDRPGKETPRKG